MTDEGDGGSSLFGGEKLPGLFHKFVMAGEWREGIITKPPRDVQSRDMAGKPKFWDEAASKPTTENTGKPLNDTLIVVQTQYMFTEQEISDRDIDPLDVEDFKGVRGMWLNGEAKQAFIKAIRKARVRTESELVGYKVRGRRGKKVPVPGTTFQKWTDWEFELTKP